MVVTWLPVDEQPIAPPIKSAIIKANLNTLRTRLELQADQAEASRTNVHCRSPYLLSLPGLVSLFLVFPNRTKPGERLEGLRPTADNQALPTGRRRPILRMDFSRPFACLADSIQSRAGHTRDVACPMLKNASEYAGGYCKCTGDSGVDFGDERCWRGRAHLCAQAIGAGAGLAAMANGRVLLRTAKPMERHLAAPDFHQFARLDHVLDQLRRSRLATIDSGASAFFARVCASAAGRPAISFVQFRHQDEGGSKDRQPGHNYGQLRLIRSAIQHQRHVRSRKDERWR